MYRKKNNNITAIQWPSLQQSYLGNKGYTIFKHELTIQQQLELKNLLTITPFVLGSPIQNNIESFPSYRESNNKIYIPIYFGLQHFGLPIQYKIFPGETIHLQFQGQLRDYQIPIVNTFLEHVSGPFGGCGLLEMYCGSGKTDTTIYIIGQLQLKTIIIVHKTFLKNQWEERIRKYYPNARIGYIQGQTIDIDNKDIVIAMLQSLSMKEYPSSLFQSFGFTIIDEVHHISSQVFSCALFKLVTKYMLGLSATMERKDGTTPVFKMFLGDVVYKLQRTLNDDVIVRAITFQSNNDDFNRIEKNFRGDTNLAGMLSKLTTFNPRTEFILQIIRDMILENPRQQIMILASYKNILSYLFTSIIHHNICSVGYYIGGMKDSELKKSEQKQVILATFSMASEALDIKTLTTLLMATPMTNIEQSVGRILRQKHDFNPIVVDIIDTHDNFLRQWNKRKTFYKKQNYTIIQTNSKHYNANISTWKTIHKSNINHIFTNSNIKSNKTSNTNIKHHFSKRSITDDDDDDNDDNDNDNDNDDDVNDYVVVDDNATDNNNTDDTDTNTKNNVKPKCLLTFKKS